MSCDLLWTRPDWLSTADEWVDAALGNLGLVRTGPSDQIHAYPWATVLRVPTSAEALFFKAMVPLLAHEARVIAVLARLRPSS